MSFCDDTALYLTIAHLAWGFQFAPLNADELPDASIETGYTGGFNIRPHPFACSISPRSETIKEAILREGSDALEWLKVYEVHYD